MATRNIIVTLQNIDDEDFVFEYNASEGNPPYLMPAGEVVRYPDFIARLALKHLIDKILNKRNERTDNEALRTELANQIVIGEESAPQKAALTEAQRLIKEVEELNKPSALDSVLAKRKEENDYKREAKKEEKKQTIETGDDFEGLEDEPEVVKSETKTEESPKVETTEVKAKPTRNELYTFAEKEMNLTLDEKTIKKFDKMKVEDLMKELQYPED